MEEIVLVSGDSDFHYLVKKLRDVGKGVIVYASRRTLAWELKLSASQVIYFEDLKSQIERFPSHK